MGNLFAKIYGAYLEGYFSFLLFYPRTPDVLHTLFPLFFSYPRKRKHTQSLTFLNMDDDICKIRYHVTHSRAIFFTDQCWMIISYCDTHPSSTTAIYNMYKFFLQYEWWQSKNFILEYFKFSWLFKKTRDLRLPRKVWNCFKILMKTCVTTIVLTFWQI